MPLIRGDIQMAYKHMKRYSTSFFIREMQIKTRYHNKFISLDKVQKSDNTKFQQGFRTTIYYCWWEYKIVQPLEGNPQLTARLNINISYHPVTALFGICQTDWKTHLQKNLHINVYDCYIHNYQKLGEPRKPSID